MKVRKRIVVLLLLLVFCITGLPVFANIPRKSAKASPYFPVEKFHEAGITYYFSDSDPTFKEYANMFGLEVVFDNNYFITPQGLDFLLYSGYFWGFNSGAKNVAIIEIKTMHPSQTTLDNLFYCLQQQNCAVMFISPFVDEYSLDGVEFMKCNRDKYERFLRNAARSMNENDSILPNTAFFIDGRLLGAEYWFWYEDVTSMIPKLLLSSTLTRLMLYMNFGCDSDKEVLYEEELYREMWNIYTQWVQPVDSFTLNYFEGDTNLEDYMEFWQRIEEYCRYNYYEFNNYIEKLCELYVWFYDGLALYYYHGYENGESVAKQLLEKKVRIIVHLRGNQFCSILEMIDGGNAWEDLKFIEADDTGDFIAGYHLNDIINGISKDTFNVYSMSRYYIDDYFHDFLEDCYQGLKDIKRQNVFEIACEDIFTVYPTYIWEIDPFEDSDGLPVMREHTMQEAYGNSDEEVFDEWVLIDEFYNLATKIIDEFLEA